MKKVFLLITTITIFSSLAAWDWPDDPNRIISAFGQSWSGQFEYGIRFRAEGQRVTTWHPGEIVWTNRTDNSISVQNKYLIVIEHDNGFRTIYRGVECRPDMGNTVQQGDWIGYADREMWQFQIIDTRNSRIINPAHILPQIKYDRILPKPDVKLSMGETELQILDNMHVPPGYWDIILTGITSTIIPLNLTIYWRNQKRYSLEFNTLTVKDNVVNLESPVLRTYNEIYDMYNRLLFRDILQSPNDSGEGILKIRLESARDNQYTWEWKLNLNSDSQ